MTMTPTEAKALAPMTDLIARIESADGPDRELVDELALAIDQFLSHQIERDTLACDLTQSELTELATGLAAIAAMTVQSEPVGWLYVRRADAWPPAPPRISLTRWPEDGATRDYWDEHALGIIPTPPAGGSDAEE